MEYLIALAIFAALSAGCWYVSLALYKSTFDGPDPTASPECGTTGAVAIGVATVTSFAPFPVGYIAGLVVWAIAVFAGLKLSMGRGIVLFGYLAASSFLSRLIVLGVMNYLGD
jgi:hypothetical protein